MFDVFATAAETLPKHQLKVFFNHCDHHPSEKDINFAFNAVFRSTYFKPFGVNINVDWWFFNTYWNAYRPLVDRIPLNLRRGVLSGVCLVVGVCLGVCLPRGGFCLRGVSAQGTVCLEGCLPNGVCVTQHAMGQTAPPPTPDRGQNDRQVWKHYLAPNFVCGRLIT